MQELVWKPSVIEKAVEPELAKKLGNRFNLALPFNLHSPLDIAWLEGLADGGVKGAQELVGSLKLFNCILIEWRDVATWGG